MMSAFRMQVVFYTTLILIVVAAASAVGDDSDAIDIGTRKQLFLDDSIVDSCHNVTFMMNPPCRTGEILIAPDETWETSHEKAMIGLYSSVLKEDGKIRVWYDLIVPTGPGPYDHERRVCYAESTDGIRFSKPKLGLHKVDGSTANNVVLPGVIGGCAVWIDPNAAPEHRYKTQAKVYPSGQLHMHSSPDGIHWMQFSNLKIGPGGWDTQTVVCWDSAIKRYVMYTRRWIRPTNGQTARYRTVRRLESEDLRKWTDETTVMEADETDLATYPTPPDQPPLDFYGATVFSVPEADRATVMLAQAFWHFIPTEREGHLGPSTFDVQLAVSPDGKTFTRVGSRRPFMTLGPAGGFDSRWVWALPNPVRMGDEIWIYYVGTNRDHNDGVDPEAPGGKILSGISRAVMRLDGFISADAPYEGAELVTKPLRFRGKRLELNVDCGAGGSIRVELLDANGNPLKGFSGKDAPALLGNSVRLPVSWESGESLGRLAAEPIRIRFSMRDCKLYAFRFVE